MAQHVIPAAQLVPQYKPIGRCNNCAVLQSIPCSPECKIVGLILLDHCLNHALTTTVDVPAVYLQQFWRTVSKYPRFTKLIIVDLMNKFPNIPKRIEEDYHSIKDDIPLVKVYTKGNISVRGMMIPDAFLTTEIMETDGFKEYKTVFMKVAILMNQPELVVSTQGTNRNTPIAHRSPTIFADPPETKKRKQTAEESSSPRKSLKITIKQRQIVEKDDDSEDRIEPRSHKDNLEFVDDDDDKAEEKHSDDMGSLEIRNEETHTTIPTPLTNTIIEDHDAFRSEVPSLVSQEFNAHAPAIIEELFKNYVQSNVVYVHPTTTTSTKTKSSATLQYQLYLKMKRSLQDRADDIALWEELRRKFENFSPFNTSCMEDDFHSQHDEHQDDDAPPERGEKSKKSQQQEWDAWEEENVIDEDEVIPEYKTPKLIAKFQNVDKQVSTIFDRARMEATLRDSLRIERYQMEVNLTAPTLTFPGIEERVPYSIVDEPQTSLVCLNTQDEKRVMYLKEIVKFYDATLEKVLNEVKLRMFESQFLKKLPLLSDLDQDIMKACEREISKRLSH
ncbi:hypothetical protein Tco_0872734 [Tanacetum coccineum]